MNEEEKSQQIVLRSADRVNDPTFERIWKYYYDQKDAIALKPKEEEIRKRLENIWGHLADILTDRQAVMAHMKWCEDQGYSVRETVAYEDLKYCKMLFGDRRKQTKASLRAISNDILINAINKAKRQGKLMSLARLIKEYNELNDLKNHTDENGDHWRPTTIIFNSDPETLRKQTEELRKRADQANNTIDITPADETPEE